MGTKETNMKYSYWKHIKVLVFIFIFSLTFFMAHGISFNESKVGVIIVTLSSIPMSSILAWKRISQKDGKVKE